VGEKLSEELTRTKESLERKQEVAVSTEETARRHEETIGGLQTQCSELKKQLAKAQTVSDTTVGISLSDVFYRSGRGKDNSMCIHRDSTSYRSQRK